MLSLALDGLAGLVRTIGRVSRSSARHAGGMGFLAWRAAKATLAGRVHLREVVIQAYSMGVQSVPLVIVTGVLSGVVTSQQGGYRGCDPGAGAGDDRLRPHRPGGGPHHRGARHHAGLGADPRPLLPRAR